MTSEADKVNKALEAVGSPYRASPGSSIGESMAALMEALPSYIDHEIERQVRSIVGTHTATGRVFQKSQVGK